MPSTPSPLDSEKDIFNNFMNVNFIRTPLSTHHSVNIDQLGAPRSLAPSLPPGSAGCACAPSGFTPAPGITAAASRSEQPLQKSPLLPQSGHWARQSRCSVQISHLQTPTQQGPVVCTGGPSASPWLCRVTWAKHNRSGQSQFQVSSPQNTQPRARQQLLQVSAAAVGFHPGPKQGLGSICLVQNGHLSAERGRCPVCQGCLGSPLAAWAVRWLCAVQKEALQGQLEHWHKVLPSALPQFQHQPPAQSPEPTGAA